MELMSEKNTLYGRLLEIQRLSTEDGPGIRTTVFLKGCYLSCQWCHNPESISFKPQLQWLKSNCIGCQSCVSVCPNKALSFIEDEIIIDKNSCKADGICTEECPSGALVLMGKDVSVDEVVKEVLKDKSYFVKSGGGVTLSGGEPIMQHDFALAFFKKMKENSIHTALDTCGLGMFAAYEKILPYTDLILYDIKEIDPEKHKKFTGISNEKVLENLKLISEWMNINHMTKELWIRTPIIPDATSTEENLQGIGKFIYENNIHPTRWELCAFNNLCRDKYSRLGIPWLFEKHDLIAAEIMEHLLKTVRNSGVDKQIVLSTGQVKSKETARIKSTMEPKPVDFCKITGLPEKD
jgi:pyruvate formate lyase activating enzyme